MESLCLAGSLDLPALKTRAQYKSNNHLTGGTLLIRKAVMPNWGFWGSLGSHSREGA